MAIDIKALRAMRGVSQINALTKSIEKTQKKTYDKDDRFWSYTADEAGNYQAVIRFLPKHERDDVPWVRIFQHSFKNETSGKWYIENSLTTLNQTDPVVELNNELWNSGIKANRDIASKQKRKLSYICNILVIKDSKNPEMEGQVKLFKFGKMIFDKITDVLNPTFEDDEPCDVFNPYTGADFRLKVCKVEKQTNYNKSSFDKPSVICDEDEEKMVEVLNNIHWLGEFITPDKFKTFGELQKRLDFVLGKSTTPVDADGEAIPEAEEKPVKKTAPAPKVKSTVETPVKKLAVESDDDEMSYFAKLNSDSDGDMDDDIPF